MSKKGNKNNDLGFGSKFEQTGGRLINKDGSFNIIRKGDVGWDTYQYLINVGNLKFLSLTISVFLFVNAIFAIGFLLIGTNQFRGIPEAGFISDFAHTFFFSIQTFTTVGYGAISPDGIAANALASLCALVGLLGAALVTGLFFARFTSPKSHIQFSAQAVINTLNNKKSLQCRLVNTRSHKILNLHARMVMSWSEMDDLDVNHRKFKELKLERDRIVLFPLNWTLSHKIDEHSPLYNKTLEELKSINAEFLIMVTAYDESYNLQIHVDSSYTCDEVVTGAKFKTMYTNNENDNATVLNLDELDEIERE